MSEQQWFYMQGQTRRGPLGAEELCELFKAGTLGLHTLVYNEAFADWVEASTIEGFRKVAMMPLVPGRAGAPSLTMTGEASTLSPVDVVSAARLPVAEARQAPRMGFAFEDSGRTATTPLAHVRPWVRLWARCIDNLAGAVLFAVLLAVAAAAFGPPATFVALRVIPLLLMLGFLIFFEALVLAAFGTTLGKGMLGVRLTEQDGRRLSYSRALSRTFGVYLRGLGLGVPLVSFVTMVMGYNKLAGTGMTAWDRGGRFQVRHDAVGPLRGSVALAVLLGLPFLFVAAASTTGLLQSPGFGQQSGAYASEGAGQRGTGQRPVNAPRKPAVERTVPTR